MRDEADRPGRTRSWYIKSCEFQARNYLKQGRSVDSLKRARNLVRFGDDQQDFDERGQFAVEVVDPCDGLQEVMARDIVDLVVPQLNETQRQILRLLLKGMGVREIARQLRITHPAVIKHRKKIAGAGRKIFEGSLRYGATMGAEVGIRAFGNGGGSRFEKGR